ncbi:hypothetical protein BMD_0966 [Priestia megaterium DSM 319]|uniref:Uncharacterized protein n=1 Tax=Priestia megaterium (strain DSM 319 / IMG 1521) TaxID=592022 RepID=D5DCK7_PRIM3|nr:hypothetical protein BMD_0966 [Priestia megaterium DSM 319]
MTVKSFILYVFQNHAFMTTFLPFFQKAIFSSIHAFYS